jgi:hypothetical protein
LRLKRSAERKFLKRMRNIGRKEKENKKKKGNIIERDEIFEREKERRND